MKFFDQSPGRGINDSISCLYHSISYFENLFWVPWEKWNTCCKRSFWIIGLEVGEVWSPPKKGSVHPQMAVTNFRDLCEKDYSHFDSTTLFGNYLDLKNALGIVYRNFHHLHEEGYWKICKTFIPVTQEAETLGAKHLLIFFVTPCTKTPL